MRRVSLKVDMGKLESLVFGNRAFFGKKLKNQDNALVSSSRFSWRSAGACGLSRRSHGASVVISKQQLRVLPRSDRIQSARWMCVIGRCSSVQGCEVDIQMLPLQGVC